MSVPMSLSYLERRNARVKIFKRFSIIMPVSFDLKRTNSAKQHMGVGRISMVSHARVPKRQSPNAP